MCLAQLQDLKKYFDSCNGDLDPETVKVRDKHNVSIIHGEFDQ